MRSTINANNMGGALAEFGRADRPFLLVRTYMFPRGYDPHHDAATDSLDEVHERSIELAYESDGKDELLGMLETLTEEAATNDIPLTTDDLTAYLKQGLGGRLDPSYSGVNTDGLKHYERLGQCFSWTTEDDLRPNITNVPWC